MTAQTDADGVKIAGFGDDGNRPAAPGGGLLVDFFDKPTLNELAGDFGDAGGRKLAVIGDLNTRDRPVLVDQAVNGRTVKLFNEVNVTNLSLSA